MVSSALPKLDCFTTKAGIWRRVACLAATIGAWVGTASAADVGPVPEAVRQQLELSPFYHKFIDADGFPILGSEKVSDDALREAHYIIQSMLAGSDHIRQSLITARFRCAIMSEDEFTTDIPEHHDLEPKDFWDRRARGLGPTRHRPAISGAEENLLQYQGDPYAGENILVHEFAHAIHEALRVTDPEFDVKLEETYDSAMDRGLWKGKYAASNRYEYWGECVQSYFGDNRENDASHNHVNTREELFAYDPDMARLINDTFRGNPWKYVPPDRRPAPERLHLQGYDPAQAASFVWPERLQQATKKRRENRAGSSIEHVPRVIEGWTVQVDIQLLEGFDEEMGRQALQVLGYKLREISLLVPADRLRDLRQVPVFVDREHPALKNAQYHPSADWLAGHGFDTEMARAVHLPRARELVTTLAANEQPYAVLHELAHAYHDRVLGFDESRVQAAWQSFREKLDSPEVLHISGRRRPHYGLQDQKEFFAEMTEAFFGTNDFYPFVRGELKEAFPEIHRLLADIWGVPTKDHD